MEGRLFTFLGTIGGHGQEWIILSHFVLVIGIEGLSPPLKFG